MATEPKCKCGAHMVFFRGEYVCSTLTTKPCKYIHDKHMANETTERFTIDRAAHPHQIVITSNEMAVCFIPAKHEKAEYYAELIQSAPTERKAKEEAVELLKRAQTCFSDHMKIYHDIKSFISQHSK